MRAVALVVAVLALGAASCGDVPDSAAPIGQPWPPPPSVAFDLAGPFVRVAPACTPDPVAVVGRGLLDLGADVEHANDYLASFRVVDDSILLMQMRTFYTQADGAPLADTGDGLPTSAENARIIGLGPPILGYTGGALESPAGTVDMPIVNPLDAALLRGHFDVAAEIVAHGLATLSVHITALGKRSSAPANIGIYDVPDAISAPIEFPLDVCVGCLVATPACADGAAPIANAHVCTNGDDAPALVCPN